MKISHENRVKVLKTLIRLFLFQSNIFVPINMFLLANCCQGLLRESIMRFLGMDTLTENDHFIGDGTIGNMQIFPYFFLNHTVSTESAGSTQNHQKNGWSQESTHCHWPYFLIMLIVSCLGRHSC